MHKGYFWNLKKVSGGHEGRWGSARPIPRRLDRWRSFSGNGGAVLQRPIARCFVSIRGAHQGPWSIPTDTSCKLFPARIRPEGARCLLNGFILQAASRSGDEERCVWRHSTSNDPESFSVRVETLFSPLNDGAP